MTRLKRTYFDITNYAYCSFFISDSNTIQDAQLLSSNSYTSLVNNDNGYWTGNYGSTTVAEVHGAETEVGNSPCFESGTLISTNRGLVEVENLKQNDLIKSYNHELGIYEYKPIAAVIDHGQGIYNVIRLDFSDGSNIGFITCHGLFDLDKNRYVNIDETNYLDYIGHRFAKSLGDEYEEVTLTNATIGKKFTHSYTVLSSENINCEANGDICKNYV